MSKILGAALGAALQNHEAIKRVGAPAAAHVGGGFKVIWNTLWKTTVLNIGIMMMWLAAFAASYMLTVNPVLGSPMFMGFLALVIFIFSPMAVFIREARRMGRVMAARKVERDAAAAFEQEQQEAQYAQMLAAWEAQQGQEAAGAAS